jgi:ABC-type bacteriocin/lantibiotic exporter with double-glycine peptidase domain
MLCLCGIGLQAQSGGVWLDIPFIKQERNGCGAASMAMVMQYWQRQQSPAASPDPEADADRIQRALFSEKDHGIHAVDMERYFQQHGFRTFAFAAGWDDLRQHLEKGRPLIVALKPILGERTLHYVVVAGLDVNRNLVMVNDPAQRKLLKEDRGAFEKEWKATGNWTLLVAPQARP